jgi:hypothetical protein
MSEAEILEALAGIQYAADVREPPDEPRRVRFRDGWVDAADRGRVYTEETLDQLTWQNLGYRLGRKFGHRPADEIDGTFEVLARHYGGAT